MFTRSVQSCHIIKVWGYITKICITVYIRLNIYIHTPSPSCTSFSYQCPSRSVRLSQSLHICSNLAPTPPKPVVLAVFQHCGLKRCYLPTCIHIHLNCMSVSMPRLVISWLYLQPYLLVCHYHQMHHRITLRQLDCDWDEAIPGGTRSTWSLSYLILAHLIILSIRISYPKIW